MFRRVTIAAALAATPAIAQEPQCLPRQQAVEVLQGTYGETRQVVELSSRGYIIEWWQSPEGTFTITGTNAAGLTCIMGDGDNASLLLEPAGEAM